jgi:Spy/CpxP family protein refolding chaperone
VVLTLAAFSLLIAQDPGISLPRPIPAWDEVKQYLVLTDAQMATLEQIRQSRSQAEQAIYQQISAKEREMYGLLQQGSNDSATIGRLMVEINNLRRQLPLNSAPYRTQALAALTDAQKAKLAPLAEALRLQSPAWQAVQLNLVEGPAPNNRILPYPMPLITEAASPEAAVNVR